MRASLPGLPFASLAHFSEWGGLQIARQKVELTLLRSACSSIRMICSLSFAVNKTNAMKSEAANPELPRWAASRRDHGRG